MNPDKIPFDQEHYQVITRVREEFLRHCFSEIPFRNEMKSALDVGCGGGHFTGVMHGLGLQVTGVDLREENLELCRARYPDCLFQQVNLDSEFDNLDTYDLVLMFGVLYHLQSPLQTIWRLAKSVGRLAIISTRVAAGTDMSMYLFREKEGMAHNATPVVAVPTFPAFLALFAQVGFDYIYLPDVQPKHPQWSEERSHGKRVSFLAAREPMSVATWRRIEPPSVLEKWEQASGLKQRSILARLARVFSLGQL
ncbi:MAG: class I SAM-dependent methyltransferase [Gemmataceae bacterium]